MSMEKTRMPKLDESHDKFVPATVGLPNEENTGWLNVIVQCLCNADPLVKYFLANQHKTDLRKKYWITLGKGKVAKGLARLFQNMWNPSTKPESLRDAKNKFKEIIGQVDLQWKGDYLQDAVEFLIWLVYELSEELNLRATRKTYQAVQFSKDKSEQQLEAESIGYHSSRNKSIIEDRFLGFFRSSSTCSACNKDCATFHHCLYFWLPIPTRNGNQDDSVTLADCFNCYTALDQSSPDGTWTSACVHCDKKVVPVRQTQIWTTPQILVLILKRFEISEGHSPLGKQVDYPIEGLDLSPWVKSPRNEGNIYDLFGVVTYSPNDSACSTFYLEAYCKNPVDHAWRKFSDERFKIVELEEFALKEKIRKEASILFYKRRGNAD